MTRLSLITLAVVLATQPHLAVAEESIAAAEAAVEVISVTGKRVAYANNVADESAKLQQASISNVMDLIDKLPGVNVGQGDAFGSDDYTTTVSMRGFVIDRADQQLGITQRHHLRKSGSALWVLAKQLTKGYARHRAPQRNKLGGHVASAAHHSEQPTYVVSVGIRHE